MRLAVNESVVVTVDPAIYNVDSGIDVAPGEELEFAASGMWQDATQVCNADGWTGNLFFQAARIKNRLPGRNYFLLCLNLDKADDTSAAVGAAPQRWRVPGDNGAATRRLYFFANDWPSMYDNNHALPPEKGGPLKVTVKRIA